MKRESTITILLLALSLASPAAVADRSPKKIIKPVPAKLFHGVTASIKTLRHGGGDCPIRVHFEATLKTSRAMTVQAWLTTPPGNSVGIKLPTQTLAFRQPGTKRAQWSLLVGSSQQGNLEIGQANKRGKRTFSGYVTLHYSYRDLGGTLRTHKLRRVAKYRVYCPIKKTDSGDQQNPDEIKLQR